MLVAKRCLHAFLAKQVGNFVYRRAVEIGGGPFITLFLRWACLCDFCFVCEIFVLFVISFFFSSWMMCSGKPLFRSIVRISYHSRLIAWRVMGVEIILLFVLIDTT